MITIITGVFPVLHGIVHLLYFGQSARLFVLQPGMVWPDGSWAFSKLIGDNRTRTLAGIFSILSAAGFVISGAGIFTGQSWWQAAVAGSAALSAVLYILFWNGRLQHLDRLGGIGLLIDLAILLAVLVLQ